MALTPKQQRFVDEYVVDLNGKQAAIRAGCSPRSAEVTASKWLRIPKVSEAVAAKQKKVAEKLELDATMVLKDLLVHARADFRRAYDKDGRLLPVHEIPDDVALAITSTKVFEEWGSDGDGGKVPVGEVREVKFSDKLRALELLGKHLKLFTDKLEVKVDGSFADLLKKARERARRR